MLKTYILDMRCSSDEHLSLLKFADNNNHQASIGRISYEALYSAGRQFTGMILVSKDYWDQKLYNKQSRRFR